MPYEDDEVRRAARERLQARMERRGSANTLASQSGSRSSGRSSSEKSPGRKVERDTARYAERSRAGADSDSSAGVGAGVSGAIGSARDRVGDFLETSGDNRTVEVGPVSFDLPFAVPDRIPPIAVPIAALIIILLLIFAVLIPSCSRASAPASTSQSAASVSAAASDASASAASASASESAASANAGTTTTSTTASTTDATTTSQPTSLVLQVAQAKSKARDAVQAASSVDSVDKQESHQGALSELLGDETSSKLLAQAKNSIDALWIAAHPSAYAYDGVEVQYKVLKLAADEPAALKYVREFPENYPADSVNTDKSLAMSTSSPSSGVPDTKIPHLYQWDQRWGYTTYSSAPFGLTACGPTSLAMVYQGLTGSVDKSPYDMGKLAEEKGYMSEYEGTMGAFFTETAEELGLICEELYPDSETIRQALDSGQVVIANLAPGYFTTTGHYFVLTGLADDGTAIVNDPYSVVRSSQTWDLDTIASQSYICYGYTRATAATTRSSESDTESSETEA